MFGTTPSMVILLGTGLVMMISGVEPASSRRDVTKLCEPSTFPFHSGSKPVSALAG